MIAALVGFVLLCGLRAARAEPQRLKRALATGALAGGLALAVHSLFDFNLHLPSNALLFELSWRCCSHARRSMLLRVTCACC